MKDMKEADRGWIERGLAEVDRLSQQYRVPGDDQLAFQVGVPATP